jgi:hypothetical protein
MESRRFLRLAAALTPILLLAGCVVGERTRTGPVQYDTQSFEKGKAEELHLDLRMGAGDLKVGTGTSKLAQAYFTYNVPDWKPESKHDPNGGILSIRQPEGHRSHFGSTKYEWDLRVAEDIPLYVRVEFGAGQAQLDLGSMNLRDVQVDMGVGHMTMDLRGNPKRDYSVRVHGGVGEAIVRLPGNVGVQADANGGIGSIQAQNLKGSHGHWVNDAWDSAKVRVRVNVEGGVGSIRLIGE